MPISVRIQEELTCDIIHSQPLCAWHAGQGKWLRVVANIWPLTLIGPNYTRCCQNPHKLDNPLADMVSGSRAPLKVFNGL